jgi:hypothetical protein
MGGAVTKKIEVKCSTFFCIFAIFQSKTCGRFGRFFTIYVYLDNGLVLGRVKDSSSHDSILFAFFAVEREDSSLYQGLASRSLPQVISKKEKS